MKIEVKRKVWLEHKGRSIMGRGRYEVLKGIDATKSIKRTAQRLHITEKTIQNYIQKMEERLGRDITASSRGGRVGGGKTELTQTGRQLIMLFEAHHEK